MPKELVQSLICYLILPVEDDLSIENKPNNRLFTFAPEREFLANRFANRHSRQQKKKYSI